MNIKTILVPTDFSDDAGRALEIALDLGERFGSRIVLVHAYHFDLPFTPPPIGGPLILPEGFGLLFESITERLVLSRFGAITRMPLLLYRLQPGLQRNAQVFILKLMAAV